MKPGRNDPCPCGSGKKYKKCCLEKDEAAARAELRSALSTAPGSGEYFPPPVRGHELETFGPAPEPVPEDPALTEFRARWEQFERAEYEDRIALFTATLDEPEIMEGEMAFEMLSALNRQMVERGERRRLDDLAEALRRKLPDVYAEEAHVLLSWRIENALAEDRMDALPPLAGELAARAHRDIDTFNPVAEQLAYHGQLHLLREMMVSAWPAVKKSKHIVAWGIEEFSRKTADMVLFDALEQGEYPAVSAAELRGRMETYTRIVPDVLERFLAHLTGDSDRQWTREDFRLTRRSQRYRGEEEDSGTLNLFYLGGEFLGYLRRQENVPYTRGELAREEIVRYIYDRFNGELGPRQSPLDAALGRKKPKAKPVPREPDELLCPDPETFDRHLGELMGILSERPYRAAAAFELTPAWLRFLESRGLIDADLRQHTLRQLRGLAANMREIWERRPEDPALLRGVAHWEADGPLPADAGLE